MPNRYYNALTGRVIRETTMWERVVEYTAHAERLADRMAYALDKLDAARTVRWQRYWLGELEASRTQRDAYASAVSVFEDQVRALERRPAKRAKRRRAAVVPEGEPLERERPAYVETVSDADVPDELVELWDVEAEEWEFGFDYVKGARK